MKKVLPPYSGHSYTLKMDVPYSSETLVCIYLATQHHIPEDGIFNTGLFTRRPMQPDVNNPGSQHSDV